MAGINEFVDKINSDEEFQKKIDAAADPAEALSIIKEAGFDVTEDELANCFSSAVENAEEGELSDDALDDVNGGLQIVIITSGSRAGSKLSGWFGKKSSGATNTKMDSSVGGGISNLRMDDNVGGGVTNALLSGGTIKKNNGPLIC